MNINVPAVTAEECEGVEVTRMGKRVYQDQLIERLDPRGIPYYWIGGPPPSGLGVPGTDFHAVVNRRIAVTPIQLDLTGRRLLRRLRTWNWSLDEAAHEAAHGADPGAGRGETTPPPWSRPGSRRRRRSSGAEPARHSPASVTVARSLSGFDADAFVSGIRHGDGARCPAHAAHAPCGARNRADSVV